jgi:hypothetical protein
MRKDVRAFIRRLEPAGIMVEPKPRHYRVLRDDKPLRKANGMPFMLPFSPHLILISKRLRPEARATVEYFRREGVALKVILGHRPDTSLRSHPPRASRRAHRQTGGVLPDDPPSLRCRCLATVICLGRPRSLASARQPEEDWLRASSGEVIMPT